MHRAVGLIIIITTTIERYGRESFIKSADEACIQYTRSSRVVAYMTDINNMYLTDAQCRMFLTKLR